jgi:Spy/CpxP family protein refolding chaperone
MATSTRSTTFSTGARLAGAALLVAVLGTATLSAFAQPGGFGPGHGPGMHGGGMYGGGPGMGMMMPGRGIERMLDGVNATAEQRAQINKIAESARADMLAQREAHRGLRDQMAKLFAAPNVDASAVEALRQQMLQQHDAQSRRMTQAMVDASRVLTPEQRKQLADRMAQRRELMQRHFQERQQLDGAKPKS